MTECPHCGLEIEIGVPQCPHCDGSIEWQYAEPEPETEVSPKQPAVYAESGRGRKQCGGCEVYVGNRVMTCPACGFDFASAPAKVKEKTVQKAGSVFDGPGRGRKHCPACGIYTGVMTATCPNEECGVVFATLPKEEKEAKKSPTFTEPGKGRKQCGQCGVYVGARVTNCPACNFDFSESSGVRKQAKPKVFTEDGRGRKQCEGCGVFVGYSAETCPECGHQFPLTEKEAKKKILTDIFYVASEDLPPFDPKKTIVYAPSGKPPVPLPDSIDDIDLVADWAQAVVRKTIKDYYLTPAALFYWLRPIMSDDLNSFSEVRELFLKFLGSTPGVVVGADSHAVSPWSGVEAEASGEDDEVAEEAESEASGEDDEVAEEAEAEEAEAESVGDELFGE